LSKDQSIHRSNERSVQFNEVDESDKDKVTQKRRHHNDHHDDDDDGDDLNKSSKRRRPSGKKNSLTLSGKSIKKEVSDQTKYHRMIASLNNDSLSTPTLPPFFTSSKGLAATSDHHLDAVGFSSSAPHHLLSHLLHRQEKVKHQLSASNIKPDADRGFKLDDEDGDKNEKDENEHHSHYDEDEEDEGEYEHRRITLTPTRWVRPSKRLERHAILSPAALSSG
jgi:hypothetical protein